MKKGLLALAAGMLLTAGSAQAEWYISGAFQGWSHCNANYELKETSAGVYSLDVDKVYGEFLIVQGTAENPDWGSKIGTNGQKVEADVPYNYVVGAGNFNMNGTVANATITLDTNAGTLLVAGKSEENNYDTVYLVGDFGDGWSETLTSYPLNLKEGTTNVWEGTYDLAAATSYFKMKAGTIVYGTGEGDVAVELGTAYTAAQSGEAYSIGAGSYTFSFVLDKNADNGVLTVTGKGDDPNPPTPPVVAEGMYMIGSPWSWSPSEGGEMEEVSEGVYSITIDLASENCYFAFTSELSADWDVVNAHRFGPAAPDTEVVLGSNEVFPGYDTSWKSSLDGTYTLVLDTKANTLTVSQATGVAGIGAENGEAVYFNLQGVRVANPENGLFIRVQNGKAVKVVK